MFLISKTFCSGATLRLRSQGSLFSFLKKCVFFSGKTCSVLEKHFAGSGVKRLGSFPNNVPGLWTGATVQRLEPEPGAEPFWSPEPEPEPEPNFAWVRSLVFYHKKYVFRLKKHVFPDKNMFKKKITRSPYSGAPESGAGACLRLRSLFDKVDSGSAALKKGTKKKLQNVRDTTFLH